MVNPKLDHQNYPTGEQRLSVLGLIMAFVGLFLTIVYPDIKNVGWLCLLVGVTIFLWHLRREIVAYWGENIRSRYGFYSICVLSFFLFAASYFRVSESQTIFHEKPYDTEGRRGERFLNYFSVSPTGQRQTLTIGCYAWDAQSCVAAGRFAILLSMAGWPIEPQEVERLSPTIPFAGVSIANRSDQPRPENLPLYLGTWKLATPSMRVLNDAFFNMSVPVESTAAPPDFPANNLGIFFGPEPDMINVTGEEKSRNFIRRLDFYIQTAPVPGKCVGENCKDAAEEWQRIVLAYLENCDCAVPAKVVRDWKSLPEEDWNAGISKRIAVLKDAQKQSGEYGFVLGDFLNKFRVFDVWRSN